MTTISGSMRERLEARARELHELVRTYPSPIARCDDQLPKYIALRNEAAALLQAPHDTPDWTARVSALLREIETL